MAERERQYLGNYRLLDLLGRGGFGEVYLGENIDSGLQVAIKLLYKRIVGNEVAVFQQEARILAKLEHPNIVRVLDVDVFDVEDGTHKPYLVMDYAPNGTLRERHPKGTPLPLSSVVAYVKQIAAALHYVHEQGVMHLDVKPENILLGQNDEVLLSDFGIARLSQMGSAYQAAGTPEYMAPEQITGNPCPASDQYALAIMAYEWLCGHPPFRENAENNIPHQHMHDPVPPLHEQLSISPAVEQVVLRALNKEPQQRFPSVEIFATAFERAMTSSRPVTRRAVLFGAGGVVGLALLGAGVWWEIRKTSLPLPSQPGRALNPQPSGPQGTLYLTYRGHSNVVNAVAWSPDGKRIASGGVDGTVQVWDAAKGGNLFTYHGHFDEVFAVAWSPDGKRIASSSADKTVQVWDAANGGDVFTYRGYSTPVDTVAWSPDGKRIASGGDDGTAQVWDAVDGGNVFIYRGHSGAVQSVAWSPDGKRIASGSFDRTVQVWDAANGGNAFIYRGHVYWVFAVAWSPDGKRIASASADETVQVWDAVNGGNVFTYGGYWQKTPKSQLYTSGPFNALFAVAWSPDGKRIASGSENKTVQVWDAANGGNAFIYRRHSDEVQAVAWSPDSKRIASGSVDKTVQVWQA
jgi:eukaryotic-like serine/threonine-protein kinase